MYPMIRWNPGKPARRDIRWPLTDDFFRPFADLMANPLRTAVREVEDAYLFDMEMPGYENDEIQVTLHDGVLTIAAEHQEMREGEPSFGARSIRRSFTVEDIQEESIKAQYRNGVLRVTLPKAKKEDETQPRKIDVE